VPDSKEEASRVPALARKPNTSVATQDEKQILSAACLPEVPVTMDRPPPADLQQVFANPGAPLASKAVSKEVPQGTPGTPTNATVLQQHVQFWDRDGDGVIWPNDTYVGFKRLGFNPLICVLAVPAIHTLAIFTQPGWKINPLLPFYIKRAHRAKHGSDSEVYDTEGRFVPQKFEEIFTKFDKGNKGGLSWEDINKMTRANQNAGDFFGWGAGRFEWYMLWLLCKDENGIVSKEKMRAQYDGSLWQIIADEVEVKKKGWKQL